MTDVIIAVAVFVAIVSLADVYYDLADMIMPHADPFSEVLLLLVVPSLFLAVILSLGISAMRSN